MELKTALDFVSVDKFSLTISEKLVLLNLMHLIQEAGTGSVTLSAEILNKSVDMTRRSTQRIVYSLHDKGVIEITRQFKNKKNIANKYQVIGLDLR